MTYLVLLVILAAVVLGFIAGLIAIRRRFPGDYTPLKVIAGVGLVEAARWLHAYQAGTTATFRLEQFGLMACAGAVICLWQAAEFGHRQWQRSNRRLRELEERIERQASPTRRSGNS